MWCPDSVDCRDEIAECSEKSYGSLPLAAGQKLFNFKSQDEFAAYAKQVCQKAPLERPAPLFLTWPCAIVMKRGWEVKDGRVYVQKSEEDHKAQVPSLQVIAQTLHYVKELERIV